MCEMTSPADYTISFLTGKYRLILLSLLCSIQLTSQAQTLVEIPAKRQLEKDTDNRVRDHE